MSMDCARVVFPYVGYAVIVLTFFFVQLPVI